jgi:hypothetical protein
MENDNDLIEIVKHTREIFEMMILEGLDTQDMHGTCGIATLFLKYLLEKFTDYRCVARGGDGLLDGGYIDHQGQSHGHYWLEVETPLNRFVVDITANQFGGECIVILPVDMAHQYVLGCQEIVDLHMHEIQKVFFPKLESLL